MEVKFLNDGRKVAIVGKLNNQETIVQEIFVTENGSEIPSGENFVVKSLHDRPVVSYAEKRKLEIEQRIKVLEKERDAIFGQNKKYMHELNAVKDILMSSRKLVELLPVTELDAFTSFMTGTIEYLVVDSYTITPPVKMLDKIISWESSWNNDKYDSIKLLSVLGKTDGNLEYGINRYNDGSGHHITVHPFNNKEKALAHIKDEAEALIKFKRLSVDSYNNCKEMGIVFSGECENKYKEFRSTGVKAQIEKEKSAINESEEKIKDLKSLLLKHF